MSGPQRSELERFRYWQGQSLRSRDFRDQTNMEAQLRYWHNRALHNAYGINFGLNVTAVRENADDVNSPLVAVEVDCGLAYDCFGRELVLPTSRSMKIPPVPAELENGLVVDTDGLVEVKKKIGMTLVARYKESAVRCCTSAHDAASDCWPRAGSALMDELELVWKTTACAGFKDGVPLAKVDYVKDGPATLDQDFVPPRARALARPRTASGATIPGNTPWERWEVDVLNPGTNALNMFAGGTMNKVLIGMQTTIDTSAAGFTETSCYFAWLEAKHPERNVPGFVPAFFASVTEDSVDGFTFRLLMPPLPLKIYDALDGPVSSRGGRGELLLTASLDNVVGLRPGSEVLVSDESDPDFTAPLHYATVKSVDAINNRTQLIVNREGNDRDPVGNARVVTHYNESFRTRFLSYAREQELYVCWLGLQPESVKKIGCAELSAAQCKCT